MCYHISFEVKIKSILDYFPDVEVDAQLDIEFPQAKYINGFDHRMQPAIYQHESDAKLHLGEMMWGYLPSWIKNWEEANKFWTGYRNDKGEFIKPYITLNAVGEEILDKNKMWRDSALNRRCVLFVDGFYEWRHINQVGKKGQPLKATTKYPYFIKTGKPEAPFAMMAGIWVPWKHTEIDKETGEIVTETIPTFAIVTTKANKIMEQIHNTKKRMPTVLKLDLAKEWLSKDLSEERITQIATNIYPADKTSAYTIGRDFQSKQDPKEYIKQEEVPELVY